MSITLYDMTWHLTWHDNTTTAQQLSYDYMYWPCRLSAVKSLFPTSFFEVIYLQVSQSIGSFIYLFKIWSDNQFIWGYLQRKLNNNRNDSILMNSSSFDSIDDDGLIPQLIVVVVLSIISPWSCPCFVLICCSAERRDFKCGFGMKDRSVSW
jgi:hypothetical protein